MTPVDLAAAALDAARAGRDVALSTSGAPITTKSTASDIVTQADLAAERAIREVLAAATPGARLLAEESGHSHLDRGDRAVGDDRIEWIVDPLDGTVNFSYGVPISAVSIAAAIDGSPVAAAVVSIDGLHEFTASAAGGASRNGQPLAVSACSAVSDALVATGFAYDAARRARHAELVAELAGEVRDIRAFGSAALHLCWVAAGWLDAYVEHHIKPWDYAAGALIASEAGARVELPCPENEDLVAVAPPALFDQLRPHLTA